MKGLTSSPKTLSPWLFYDAEGSRLFEQITRVPEYYLTRAERSIFAENADQIVAAAKGQSKQDLHVLELGAGSASKTGLLLKAAVRSQGEVLYQPIDVSSSALAEARAHLQSAVPGVKVEAHVADYTLGYNGLTRPPGPRLALYIGSSIGNFEPQAALRVLQQLRAELLPGDSLLLGADLRKDPAVMRAAYNDSLGVTASFNRNVLVRINHELGGQFDPLLFRHEARWNPRRSRMEMHLVSETDQQVQIEGIGATIDFVTGESIHTENSYKYTQPRLQRLMRAAGFEPSLHWKDDEGLFLVLMATAV